MRPRGGITQVQGAVMRERQRPYSVHDMGASESDHFRIMAIEPEEFHFPGKLFLLDGPHRLVVKAQAVYSACGENHRAGPDPESRLPQGEALRQYGGNGVA